MALRVLLGSRTIRTGSASGGTEANRRRKKGGGKSAENEAHNASRKVPAVRNRCGAIAFLSDFRLARLIAARDWHAFESVWRVNIARLRNTAYRALRHHADVEDVLQNTAIKLFRHARQYKGDAMLSSWLHTILLREIGMLHRKRQGGALGSDHEVLTAEPDLMKAVGHYAAMNQGGEGEHIIKRLERGHKYNIAGALLNRMCADYALPIVLRDTMDMSISQTAATMGISVACVKSRLHRGYEHLRNRMAANG